MARYFAPMKRNDSSDAVVFEKSSVRSSATDSDVSFSDTSSERARPHRGRTSRRRASLNHLASAIKGRVLAPGSFVGSHQWLVSRQGKSRSLFGQTRESVIIHALQEQEERPHYYHCQLRRDSFTVRDAAGKAILQCITASDKNSTKTSSILYGTRPLLAGNPATHKISGRNFYPWYKVERGNGGGGGVSVEVHQHKALLWYCEEESGEESQTTLQFQSTLFGGGTAAEISKQEHDGQQSYQVTIQPGGGADPAVMIAIALLLSKL